MSGSWAIPSLGKRNVPFQFKEELLDEEVVLLMRGANVFNDKVFVYIQLTLRNLQRMKRAMDGREKFLPSDFGTVLAAGKGDPSEELRAEMAEAYNIADLPQAAAAPMPPPAHALAQPHVWGEGE